MNVTSCAASGWGDEKIVKLEFRIVKWRDEGSSDFRIVNSERGPNGRKMSGQKNAGQYEDFF